ncbi:MAG: hypothetical protein AAFQ59_04395 [Pseudomonadota bacterium]
MIDSDRLHPVALNADQIAALSGGFVTGQPVIFLGKPKRGFGKGKPPAVRTIDGDLAHCGGTDNPNLIACLAAISSRPYMP